MTELSFPPLSWLTLERYVLDELAPSERARVERQLASSTADRACLDEILNDRSELPPLPAPTPRDVTSIDSARWRRRSLAMVGSALAVAAALALVVLRPSDVPAQRRYVRDGVKGGEVALALVGEQQGELPVRFFEGERFKLLVTCPSWLGRRLHVVVFQDGRRYQPLVQLDDFACGNRVPWPGAFALDGDAPADVCVTWHETSELLDTASKPSQLEPSVVCERVVPR